MKPVLKRMAQPNLNNLMLVAFGAAEWGWICQTPADHSRGFERFDERGATWSSTPREAWRKWFSMTRRRANGMIDDAQMLPPIRMKNRSVLARKTLGLIVHDRYLLKVDSRLPGGKGNV